jgi:hypothetical protein
MQQIAPIPTMFLPMAPYEHSLQAYIHRVPTPYRSLLFTRAQQGKVAELRLELATSGGKKDKNFSSKKIALKKIVANMTMSNNDMVALFPDIVACMGIESLEIKKMWVSPCLRMRGSAVAWAQGSALMRELQVLPISCQLCPIETRLGIESIANITRRSGGFEPSHASTCFAHHLICPCTTICGSNSRTVEEAVERLRSVCAENSSFYSRQALRPRQAPGRGQRFDRSFEPDVER